jgi:hypothetical protein
MTDFDATLQYVNGKVYELKGLDSAFHVHQPKSHLIAFYAPEHYNKELFVQLTSGEKMIFEQVAEEDINKVYQQLLEAKQAKRESGAELVEVSAKQLVDLFCQMQYHIITTNGLWATDEPDTFKNHPAFKSLWQVWFKPGSK